uniref:Ig-like domain-containing protein n=1 Tax=Oryzias latipes TaxID=8090 RepID=A0A3P9ILI3_ORYLA
VSIMVVLQICLLLLQLRTQTQVGKQLLTNWKDVFESERVEMSCEVGVSDWTFSWYKDDVLINYQMPKLSIPSVAHSNKGKYQCQILLKSRGVSSGLSNSVDINIYANFFLTKTTLFYLHWSTIQYKVRSSLGKIYFDVSKKNLLLSL